MKKILSVSLGVLMLVMGLSINSAHAATIASITYSPSGATVATAVAASTNVAIFTPITAITVGQTITATFPAGTTLAAIIAGDFTIKQDASGTSVAGAATAPSGIAFDNGAKTITFTVAAGSLSTGGDSAGLGVITIKTSGTSGSNEITHPTTATTTGTFSIATQAGDSGSISNVTFVAAALDHFHVVVTPATGLTGQNLATTITGVDVNNNPTTTGYGAGAVALSASAGTAYPTSVAQASFTGNAGVWSGNIQLSTDANPVTVTATGNTKTGTDTVVITKNKVSDMTCEGSGQAGAVWIRWTEPAQTVAGLFTGYVVKTYAAAITDANWAAGPTTFSQTWTPATAQGSAVQQLVTGLNPNTRYYFGVMLGAGADTIQSLVSDPSATCLAPSSASSSVHDTTAPTSYITSPALNSNLATNQTIAINGTAKDTGGSSVQMVEVSTNGGTTWSPATISSDDGGVNVIWKYSWVRPAAGTYTLQSRSYDWVGNRETPATGITVTISDTGSVVSTGGTTTTTGGTTTGLPYASPVGADQIRADISYLQTQLVALLQQLLAALIAQLGH